MRRAVVDDAGIFMRTVSRVSRGFDNVSPEVSDRG